MRRFRAMRLAAAGIVALVAMAPAEAHHSASASGALYRNRYLICTEAPWDRAMCAGPNRARKPILAALSGTEVSKAHDAAIAAVYFNLKDAIGPLQAMLGSNRLVPADHDQHTFFDKNGLRAEAAYALANLGDASQVAEIEAALIDFETSGYGSIWEETLEAYAVIDPDRAATYAIDFIDRARDYRMSLPGGSDKLDALRYIRPRDRAAAKILEAAATREETGYDHAHCMLQAARVRVDAAFRATVRKQFVGSYSGTWLAGCANDVMPELGVDPEDADALIRHLGRDDAGMDYGMANISYRRIIDLVARLDGSAAAKAARKKLLKGLHERDRWPHVADPTHRHYALHFVAFHTAALAGLGDEAAVKKLWTLVDDPGDQTGAAWIAALAALKLDLPGAVDHAAALIARGTTYRNTERGDVYDDIRLRVLEAFVARAPSDPRWAVSLLDFSGPSNASERALYYLSRLLPAGACDAVAAAARTAQPDQTEFAFLALTVYGTQCLPAIEAVFDDTSATPEIRGVALEFTGVLGSKQLASNIARARKDKVWEPAIQRAELWLGPTSPSRPAKPGKPGKPNQTLPPRTHKQGM